MIKYFTYDQDPRTRLRDLIIEKSLEFKKVTLASGKESNYYLDCKRVSLHPEGLACVVDLFWKQIQTLSSFPDAVAGPTLGADPLISGLTLLSFYSKKPLQGVIIRKEPKSHGTQAWLEGWENVQPGQEVVLVEDVVTTAGSSIKAIHRLREAGLKVHHVLAMVDREEGGAKALQNEDCTLFSIFQAQELCDFAQKKD